MGKYSDSFCYICGEGIKEGDPVKVTEDFVGVYKGGEVIEVSDLEIMIAHSKCLETN